MAQLNAGMATLGVALALGLSAPAQALTPDTDAGAGIRAFGENCFSPFMTAQKAAEVFAFANVAYEFYDLEPFSDVAPSPVTGRAATPGTDRRCEVSFFGDYAKQAAEAAIGALESEGILTPADLPANYVPTPGTTLLAARQLNPRRVAVVHVGTRPDANGNQETFMSVERLRPSGN